MSTQHRLRVKCGEPGCDLDDPAVPDPETAADLAHFHARLYPGHGVEITPAPDRI